MVYRLLALLWLVSAMAWARAEEPVLIYCGGDYYPVIYEEAGRPAGVFSDILNFAAQNTGRPINLKLFPWKRAYTEAERGSAGIIGLSWTAERAKVFDFSKPVYEDNVLLVTTKAGYFAFTSLKDLEGKILGGQLGTSYGDEVDKFLVDGHVTVERDTSQTGRLKKLLRGRLEAAIIGGGQLSLEKIIASDPELLAAKDRLTVLPKPLVRDPVHVAFAKSMHMQAYLTQFDLAVDAWDKLHKK